MTLLSPAMGLGLLFGFGIAMWLLTMLTSRSHRWTATSDGYLLAERKVPWVYGAPSIAASWIWAPALFVSIQKSYEFGLPGAFWFTVPNVCALLIFAWLAPKIRRKFPEGNTLPGWILYRFQDPVLHKIYLVPYVWYQLMAICVQIFVGGLMLNYLTGLPLNWVMVGLLILTLSYGLPSGMRASMITDFVQMGMILVGLGITVPMLIDRAGWEMVRTGLGGINQTSGVLDLSVAYGFGIVTSIGLLAGAISDQQYWQRSFAIREKELGTAFVVGGLLFGVVPGALALIGFVAASPLAGISPPTGTGLPMIGISAVAHFLPMWATVVFVLMLLAGLCSTLDSGLLAAASLYASDFGRSQAMSQQELVRRGRIGMLLVSAGGLALALSVQYIFSLDRLWWIFNGVAACFVVPTILSVVWPYVTAKGARYGILCSLAGMVVFVYGNWIADTNITVLSALFIVSANALMCWLFSAKQPFVDPSPAPSRTV